jgi:hypothetical protein
MLKKIENNKNSLELIQSTSDKIPLQKEFFNFIIMNSVTMYYQKKYWKKLSMKYYTLLLPMQ